jgi:hypothetical protein
MTVIFRIAGAGGGGRLHEALLCDQTGEGLELGWVRTAVTPAPADWVRSNGAVRTDLVVCGLPAL